MSRAIGGLRSLTISPHFQVDQETSAIQRQEQKDQLQHEAARGAHRRRRERGMRRGSCDALYRGGEGR